MLYQSIWSTGRGLCQNCASVIANMTCCQGVMSYAVVPQLDKDRKAMLPCRIVPYDITG